jgi:uncharacterized membrane protein
MTAFTVWTFETPEGAGRAAALLTQAEHDGLVKVVDHAVITWPVGADKPLVDHVAHSKRRSAAAGALAGLVLGGIFAAPLVGTVTGGALGAVWSSGRFGLGKEEVDEVRREVTEGTSALFAVTDQGDLDRLGERFRGVRMRLVSTNLTDAERQLLLETMGEE